MTVAYLKNIEINRNKWDECVSRAFNAQVFGYTWYLDSVCWDWDGLVEGDYNMVFPVPITKRFGITMVQNPLLLPFVTIYSRIKPSAALFYEFFNNIPFYNIKLNILPFNALPQFSLLPEIKSGFASFDLITDYDSTLQRFKSMFDMKECLEKYNNFTVMRTQNLADYLSFKSLVNNKKSSDNNGLKKLLSYALRFKSIGIFFCFDSSNTPVAAVAIIKSDNRLTVIDMAANKSDKSRCALYKILLHQVKVHAESNLVLWFPTDSFKFAAETEPFGVKGVQYRRGLLRMI